MRRSGNLRLRSPIYSGETFRARCIALFACLLLLPSMVGAQQITVNLDPAQTKIQWTLGATMHTVHGTFKLKSGRVTFEPQSGAASGEIIVDATSSESGNNSRDNKMHKEVLESQRYPEITFSPTHVMGRVADQGTSNLQVQGVFHIHGANHDLTLSLPVEKSGDAVSASTSFVVPYQEWGMKDPSTFFLKVEKTVSISISSVGRISQ
jgi:polyisoprenoid-binding protein YceI